MAVSILRGSHIPTVGPTESIFYYTGQGFQVSYFSETDHREQICFIDPSTQPPTHPPAPPSKPHLVCQHVAISCIFSAYLVTYLSSRLDTWQHIYSIRFSCRCTELAPPKPASMGFPRMDLWKGTKHSAVIPQTQFFKTFAAMEKQSHGNPITNY